MVGNGSGWFAVLVVMVANELFTFCLTVLLVLVSLVPALTEQFLWKHNHDFSQDHLLSKVAKLRYNDVIIT